MPPSVSVETPAGFKTTPLEAYHRLQHYDDTYADTSKHAWHIYADSRCYYLLDTFQHPEASSRFAFLHGIKIDGYSNLLILDHTHVPY